MTTNEMSNWSILGLRVWKSRSLAALLLVAIAAACGAESPQDSSAESRALAEPLIVRPQARAAATPATSGAALDIGSSWPSETLVATNSIELKDRARVVGSVAVTKASPGRVLSSNAEGALGSGARISGSIRVDTLHMKGGSRVSGNAHFNANSGSGKIEGE